MISKESFPNFGNSIRHDKEVGQKNFKIHSMIIMVGIAVLGLFAANFCLAHEPWDIVKQKIEDGVNLEILSYSCENNKAAVESKSTNTSGKDIETAILGLVITDGKKKFVPGYKPLFMVDLFILRHGLQDGQSMLHTFSIENISCEKVEAVSLRNFEYDRLRNIELPNLIRSNAITKEKIEEVEKFLRSKMSEL